MKEILALVRGALRLDDKTMLDLKASPDVFRKGFTVVLLVGLLVGLVAGLVGLVQGLTTDPAAEIAQARVEADRTMRGVAQFMPPDSAQMMLENYAMGFGIAERIVREARAPLPRPAEVLFKQVGATVSYPFGWLGSLLFFGVLVHIAAKLLGGRGTIAQMWGLSSLTVAPHLFDLFAPLLNLLPAVGGAFAALLGLITFAWGVAIYVKATAVAQEMSLGRAIAAVLLPIVVVFVLALLGLFIFGFLIAIATGR